MEQSKLKYKAQENLNLQKNMNLIKIKTKETKYKAIKAWHAASKWSHNVHHRSNCKPHCYGVASSPHMVVGERGQ